MMKKYFGGLESSIIPWRGAIHSRDIFFNPRGLLFKSGRSII